MYSYCNMSRRQKRNTPPAYLIKSSSNNNLTLTQPLKIEAGTHAPTEESQDLTPTITPPLIQRRRPTSKSHQFDSVPTPKLQSRHIQLSPLANTYENLKTKPKDQQSQHSRNKAPNNIFNFTEQQSKNEPQQPYYISQLKSALENVRCKSIQSTLFRDQVEQTHQQLTLIRQTPPIPQMDAERKKVKMQPPKPDWKTVVFDLDETLIHCVDKAGDDCDAIIPVWFPDGEVTQARINIRPNCKTVLEELSKLCEVVLFTASQKNYASKIIQHLDPNGTIFSACYYRDSCFTIKNLYPIKDLRIFPRDPKNIVLVDNAAISYGMQIENGIPILNFFNDRDDDQLLALLEFIKNQIIPAEDVRPVLRTHFKLNQYPTFKNGRLAATSIY